MSNFRSSCCRSKVAPQQQPRFMHISDSPTDNRGSGDGPDDCYLLPFLNDDGQSTNWRLTIAMQADDPEAFATECLAELRAAHPSEPRATLRRGLVALKLHYRSTGSAWTASDIDFHNLTHLCAYYAAANCLAKLLKLLDDDYGSHVSLARMAFTMADNNGSSIVHAACWGCYNGVRDPSAYCEFLRSALRSAGSVAVRSAAKIRDDFDFNGLELSIYLECYELAVCLLELPGVYVHSTVQGNIITKHYLVDEYLVGGHHGRFHRAPMVMLTLLATPEQLERLRESGFLEHPAVAQLGMSFSAGLMLSVQLMLWLSCVAILYWPLDFRYHFFRESDVADDSTAFLKCVADTTRSKMQVPLHAGVMLAKEDVEKRIRYALGLNRTLLAEVLGNFSRDFCPNISELSTVQIQTIDKHLIIQMICLAGSIFILITVSLVPLRAVIVAIVSHYQLKWRSLQYRHLYNRRAHRKDLMFYLCLFCWIFYWAFAAFFNTSYSKCSFYLLQSFLCTILNGSGTTADSVAERIKSIQQVLEFGLQIIGCLLHFFVLCVNLLFLYMMESAPLFGETIMMFRQVLERFLQLSLIFIACIVMFVNLFWAQTAGILLQVGADLGEFNSMDLSSFLGEFYRVFAISLNTFDPTTRQFGNSTLTMETKKAEIKLLHFIYILCFVILTLNFLVAALVSFIDRTARHKSTMHFLHRVFRANIIRYKYWHPIVRLARLIACHRRKRTLVVTATVSAKNVWTDPIVGVIPDIANDEADRLLQTKSAYLAGLSDQSKHQAIEEILSPCGIRNKTASSSNSNVGDASCNFCDTSDSDTHEPSIPSPAVNHEPREVSLKMFNRRCKTAFTVADRNQDEAAINTGFYRRKDSV